MPYKKRTDLPEPVQKALHDVPHAQDIYQEAYNHAYEEYKDPSSRTKGGTREEVAHAVAWSAVKHKYEKSDDGKWHPKK